MADTRRAKAPSFTTPKGTFRFPKLSEIDFGSKEYPNPLGEYSVTLLLQASDPATQAFIEKLTPYHAAAVAKGEELFKALKAETRKKLGGSVKVNQFFTELLDPDTEEPTGELAFKFSRPASGVYGEKNKKAGRIWDSRPTVFDAKTNVLIKGFSEDRAEGEVILDVHTAAKPNIWGGTVGKVSFELGIDRDGDPGYFINGSGAVGLKLKLSAVQVLDLVSGGERTAEDHGFLNEDDAMSQDEPVGNGGDF